MNYKNSHFMTKSCTKKNKDQLYRSFKKNGFLHWRYVLSWFLLSISKCIMHYDNSDWICLHYMLIIIYFQVASRTWHDEIIIFNHIISGVCKLVSAWADSIDFPNNKLLISRFICTSYQYLSPKSIHRNSDLKKISYPITK